jgi:hypothetical protein
MEKFPNSTKLLDCPMLKDLLKKRLTETNEDQNFARHWWGTNFSIIITQLSCSVIVYQDKIGSYHSFESKTSYVRVCPQYQHAYSIFVCMNKWDSPLSTRPAALPFSVTDRSLCTFKYCVSRRSLSYLPFGCWSVSSFTRTRLVI